MKVAPSARNKADVNLSVPSPPNAGGVREMIPLSALNQYLFCPRRAALIHVEGIFVDNHHTLLGNIVHEHADLPGYEVAKNVTLLRALPVFSDRLGLSGKCDVIERHADGTLVPVEYKKGKRRQFVNDDAQLCAQALCLEEMFGISIQRGAVFHAESKRRRDVIFTPELRSLTVQAINDVHRLIDAELVPPAEFKPACEECSLFKICLPRVTSQPVSLRRVTAQLFET